MNVVNLRVHHPQSYQTWDQEGYGWSSTLQKKTGYIPKVLYILIYIYICIYIYSGCVFPCWPLIVDKHVVFLSYDYGVSDDLYPPVIKHANGNSTIQFDEFLLKTVFTGDFMITAGYGDGSIPINTIFRGVNIHLPAILM